METKMNIDDMLPKVKETELEILSVVDAFCRQHSLKYTLAYGTLLGAVRHGGFIPWDDDIDIWMPREDYDRFKELWLNNPVDGYIIQDPYLEPEFTQNFIKIRKDKTAFIEGENKKYVSYHKGIFIDIFPLDRVADNKLVYNLQKLNAVFMMLYTRKFAPPEEKGIKKFIAKAALKVVPKSKYDSLKKHLEKSLSRKSPENGGYKCFSSMIALSTLPYSSNMFDDLEKIEFEGRMFSVTSIRDEILTKIYGDYMELPPEEERVWKHHPILIDLEHNFEEL